MRQCINVNVYVKMEYIPDFDFDFELHSEPVAVVSESIKRRRAENDEIDSILITNVALFYTVEKNS